MKEQAFFPDVSDFLSPFDKGRFTITTTHTHIFGQSPGILNTLISVLQSYLIHQAFNKGSLIEY